MPVRALTRPLVTRPLPRARWSDAVYNDIVSLIRDDAKLSLKYAGKEENFWEF